MTDKEIPVPETMKASGQSAGILVVEDEGIIAKDLERRLLRQGYIVSSVVASGEDAIRKAEECRPSLVLMDIVLLGEIDGIEAAAEIRRLFDVPVIYITAYADDRIIERAKHTEPYGYIIKPFDDRELRSSIEMALYKHSMEKKLRENEEWLSTILHSIGDGVIVSDNNGIVTFMNPVAETLTGWTLDEARGKSISDIMNVTSDQTSDFPENMLRNIIEHGSATDSSGNTTLLSKDGTKISIADSGAPIMGKNDVILGVVLIIRDVTLQKEMDLALRESEQKLRMHAMELEESNTALKVLLKQRENDRREVEENILSNVKQLILPYLEKLIGNRAMSEDLSYLKIVERNLKEIISPFSYRLSSKYFGFTPREIAIADLIRDGKQDKDIMDILNISFETVKSHRQHIRRKLGIYSKRTNLRAFLLTLEE
jgi:PAS domain S-box-containing protein